MSNFKDNFTKAYNDLSNLHPNDPDAFNLRYVNRDWFFKNHLNIVLKNIKKFHSKYYPDSNLEAALYGGLFHDAGLVYERDSTSPVGHESRSVVYATNKLKELGYDENFINIVAECIAATESDHETEVPEAVLVRNADAYSHFTSVHFFAKSNFSKTIVDFINWFSKKMDNTYKKLSIEEVRSDIKPLYEKYKRMIEIYNENQDDNILSALLDNKN